MDSDHHSVQNRLSSCVLSKNIMIRYTKLKFCPAVLMGVKHGLLHQGKNTYCVCKRDPEGNV